jgi:hypothetical protein
VYASNPRYSGRDAARGNDLMETDENVKFLVQLHKDILAQEKEQTMLLEAINEGIGRLVRK